MKTSSIGLNLIKHYEGERLTSYQDSVGVWTVGIGHTAGVRAGQTITSAQSLAFLSSDIRVAEAAINELVHVTLTQGEFDALASFTFNLGAGNLPTSTLLKLLNRGDKAGAAAEFPRWNKAGGKVLAGLSDRRRAEAHLFRTGELVLY